MLSEVPVPGPCTGPPVAYAFIIPPLLPPVGAVGLNVCGAMSVPSHRSLIQFHALRRPSFQTVLTTHSTGAETNPASLSQASLARCTAVLNAIGMVSVKNLLNPGKKSALNQFINPTM